jgi:hypothetical protein
LSSGAAKETINVTTLAYSITRPVLRSPVEEWQPHPKQSESTTEWWYMTGAVHDTAGNPESPTNPLFDSASADASRGTAIRARAACAARVRTDATSRRILHPLRSTAEVDRLGNPRSRTEGGHVSASRIVSVEPQRRLGSMSVPCNVDRIEREGKAVGASEPRECLDDRLRIHRVKDAVEEQKQRTAGADDSSGNTMRFTRVG